MANGDLGLTEADAPITEEPVTAETPLDESAPTGSVLTLTADDIPELTGKQVGDTIMFTISDIGEDGNFTITAAASEEAAPAAPAAPAGPSGMAGVEQELLA